MNKAIKPPRAKARMILQILDKDLRTAAEAQSLVLPNQAQ
jgi:hypothetical protein